MSFIILSVVIVIIVAVVLIPLAIYESKQPKEYSEFNPVEYK